MSWGLLYHLTPNSSYSPRILAGEEYDAVYGEPKTLVARLHKISIDRDRIAKRIASVKADIAAQEKRLKEQAQVLTLARLTADRQAKKKGDPATIRAQYSRLTDPKARRLFREQHARELGLK